jgi:hypothetical protein
MGPAPNSRSRRTSNLSPPHASVGMGHPGSVNRLVSAYGNDPTKTREMKKLEEPSKCAA